MTFSVRVTLEKAETSDFDAATDAKPGSDSQGHTQIWPVDLLESSFHHRDDATEFIAPFAYTTVSVTEDGAQAPEKQATSDTPYSDPSESYRILHLLLVPDCLDVPSFYHHVAIWVFGQKGHNHDPSFIQKFIHGSIPRPMPERMHLSWNSERLVKV